MGMYCYRVVFLFIVGLGGALTEAAPKIIEEKSLQYADIKDGSTTWLQMALQFTPATRVSEIPKVMDIYQVAQDKAGIASYVLVRSSFFLPLNSKQVQERMLHPQKLSQHARILKVRTCEGGQCEGEIKTTFADIRVRLNTGMVDRARATGPWQGLMKALHEPDFISAQEFTYIESVFSRGSSFSAIYGLREDLSWVQSYQIFSVKQSAYDKARFIPFFNLERNLRSVIQDLLQDVRGSILQERKVEAPRVQREPAASAYDKDLYRQKAYQLMDPEGDEALIRRAQAVPRNLLETLFSNENLSHSEDPWLPEDWETVDPLADSKKRTPKTKTQEGPSFQGRDNPVKLAEFSQMLDQVLWEESRQGLTPLVGEFHQWDPEVQKKYSEKSMVVGFSKLFVTLSLGFTSRFMKTDKEKDLWQWMVAQDYDTVTFPELFRTSYRLNKGDVYLSLLTIENLLAANWRYGGRDKLPATLRLRPITSGYNYDQDKFGTWYHFFGMILYGYATNSGFKANFVGRAEALGSNILSSGVNKTQKQWFNKVGGYVGEDLRESVESRRYLQHRPDPKFLQEAWYLNRSEDFRDRLPVVSSPDLDIQIQSTGPENSFQVVLKNKSSQHWENCAVDVMTDTGAGYYSPFKYRHYGIHLKPQQSAGLSVSDRALKGARVFLECPHKDSLAAEWLR